MTRTLRRASVALLVVPSLIAIPFAPTEARPYLAIAFVATVAFAIQTAVSEPKDLLIALLLALAPVVALVGDGSPDWLAGPLAVSILLGAELNALAWASQGTDRLDELRRRRLRDALSLAALALGGTLVVTGVSLVWRGGDAGSWLIAIGALIGIGRLAFDARGATSGREP